MILLCEMVDIKISYLAIYELSIFANSPIIASLSAQLLLCASDGIEMRVVKKLLQAKINIIEDYLLLPQLDFL